MSDGIAELGDLFAPSEVAEKPSRSTVLRPYQAKVVDQFEAAVAEGKRRPLIVVPTGGGKTVIIADIVRNWTGRGKRVLFIAHRRELIMQASNKLHNVGVDHGVLLPGYPTRPGEPVQVASLMTLYARAFRGTALSKPWADLVVIDEAHHARANTYRRIVESYPEAVTMGVTATPVRGDGRGLGSSFDALIEGPTVADLIKLGFLVPTRVYAPTIPDLKGVKTAMGDYVESQLAERMNTDSLVGDVVTHWHRLADRRKTVVFATGVQHSIHLRDQFRATDVLAEHIDGGTPAEERDGILKRLASGNVEVVCNAMVLTEGWDAPEVSCLVLARPTKNLGLYLQMAGRVLRPYPGKTDALVLDHSGAVFNHGFVDDPITWTLREDAKAVNAKHAARGKRHKPKLATCPECAAVRFEGQPCVACGWRPPSYGQAIEVQEGDLGAVDRQRKAHGQAPSGADMRRFHSMLLWIANEKGYNPGWAAHKHKEKYGCWPLNRKEQPVAPDDETRAWVKSRIIAWRKAKEKAQKAVAA